ncbi:helix-turn-helix transcriptional regulator [Acidovorax benzenivorans]
MQSKKEIIRRPRLRMVTGLGNATLSDLQNPRSRRFDPTFPKKVQLSSRAVGHFLHEIEAWLESRQAGPQPTGRAEQ